MFNWPGNLFPYSDLHSLNLDWLLSKMKEIATQAAQAIADSAKALAQVIEAKTAAQNAQTAAQNAQTAANNAQTAANNAATSAENAVNVAQQAKSAAQTAQNTANTAQTAAQNAQNTADAAQATAQNAASAVNTLNNKFPIQTADIADSAVTAAKIANNSINNSKVNPGSLFLTAFYKSSLYTIVSRVTGGSVYDKNYTGEPLEFEYGPAEKGRVNMAIISFSIDGETHAVSVPGDNPVGEPLTYRRRLVRSNGQDLIVSVSVSVSANSKVTFNIDNYADSGLSPFHVYFHTLQMSTAK